MNPPTLLLYITAVGIIVSAVLSIWDGRRQSKHSEASAERAEAAGRVSDENAQRVITALEQMAANSHQTGTYVPPEKVRWSMNHYKGDTYQVTNIGNITAEQIEIGSHESLFLGNQEGGPNLTPDEALTFMAAQTLATSDSTVTVKWKDANGDHDWRYPLPARPPR